MVIGGSRRALGKPKCELALCLLLSIEQDVPGRAIVPTARAKSGPTPALPAAASRGPALLHAIR